MVKDVKDRVFFYSKEDTSWVHNLKKAEVVLDNVDLEGELTINDLMELYSIKLYFDNQLFHLDWNESQKDYYKEIVKKSEPLIQKLFLAINDHNLINSIEQLEFDYKKKFWKLFEYYQVYKRIGKEVFKATLNALPFHINYILTIKNTVNHFGEEMKAFLLNYEKTAELLLTNFEENRRNNSPTYYFPNCLSLLDKEKIISKYIVSKDANLNYIRLIEKSSSSELKLSARVKLQAKKRGIELNDKILEGENTWTIGIEVILDKDQETPVELSNENSIFKASYSEIFLNTQETDLDLFHLFSRLFAFTDSTGLINLVSKQNELDTIETIFITAKSEYVTGLQFEQKAQLSNIQVALFDHYLNGRNNSVERLVGYFVNQHFNSVIGNKGIRINLPSANSTYFEKIRVLAPEFEFLLKQFQSYVVDDELDFELLEFNSNSLDFAQVKSFTGKKYAYENGNLIKNLRYYFFSDQSLVYYIEPFEDKYDNLYDLLTNENVALCNFKSYQQDIINHLLQEDYLYLDENDHVKIKRVVRVFLIGEIQRKEVLNYWYYPDYVRSEIDRMIAAEMLVFEGTLFTKQEVNYFNYHLNKKEFTNGFDLRNKYLHGTNSTTESIHKRDYYVLLKLLILALIKIEHELVIGMSLR